MAVKEVKTKSEIIEILDANDIAYRMTNCNGYEKFAFHLMANQTEVAIQQ